MKYLEVEKGYVYWVKGHENEVDFALGILALVNARSSAPNTIADVKTFYGNNDVRIVAYTEQDGAIESHIGTITSKEEINLLKLGLNELDSNVYKDFEKLQDDWLDNDGKEVVVMFDDSF